MKEKSTTYLVKKGPADPFRGDWYIDEMSCVSVEEAIAHAASLTLANYTDYLASWEEFGYEWSVFEQKGETEIKIWEGFKYIKRSNENRLELKLGAIE